MFTIEVWGTIDGSNDPSATFFSFGTTSGIVALNTSLITVANVTSDYYLVASYNSITKSSKIYSNGALVATEFISWSAFQDTESYIGRNFAGTGPGLVGSVDEFRIWYGGLPASVIRGNYKEGVNPTTLQLTDDDMKITFMMIALREVAIGFYGGVSQFPMFGAETLFSTKPVDTHFAFSENRVPLDPKTSSADLLVHPMPYTVSLISLSLSAPAFGSCTSRDDVSSGEVPCYCSPSNLPYQYLSDANQLSQVLPITNVTSATQSVVFTYQTGIRFKVINESRMSVTRGVISDNPESACYSQSTTVLQRTAFYCEYRIILAVSIRATMVSKEKHLQS